jgi:hypothetical protein
MSDRGLTLGMTSLAAVALVSAIGGARLGSRPMRPVEISGTQVEHAGGASVNSARSHGEALLGEFFGSHWVDAGILRNRYELKVLIAALPDPYDSHLDFAHDVNLEAIRRAFETSGFVIDRFWLPSARDSLGVEHGGESARMALREVEPGVVLFRHSNPSEARLRMLLLVPELPTRGVDKAALLEALRLRTSLLGFREPPLLVDPSEPVRIIGPSFSGSSLSLQLVLRAWRASPEGHDQRVQIVSGTATSPGNLQTLNRPEFGLSFSATINSDASLERMRDSILLGPLGLRRAQVALLRESSTQYGQALTDDRGGPGRTADATSMVVLSFPMSISSLRSEYERVPSSRTDDQRLPGVTEAPRLPLDLLDPARPKEDLPVTSRLSAPALDLVLDEVARTLVRRRIRMVGLLATDVRDKLFLGDEIRRRVPDVQFFTYESNVLYLRSDRTSALRGMLVFSTYPLLLQNQRADSGSRTELRTFASDGAEGVYNATLVQLGDASEVLDYRSGRNSAPRPPVWLTTVGNGTFLPVARMTVTGPDTGYLFTCAACTAPGNRAWPGIAFLPLAAFLLASLGLLVAAFSSLLGDRQLYQRLAGETLNGEAETLMEGSLALHDRLYSVLRLIAMGGTFQAAAIPAFRVFAASHVRNSLSLLIGGVSACIGIWALGSGTRSIYRMMRRYGAAGWQFVRYGPWIDATARWNARLEFTARTAVGLFGVMYLVLSLWLSADIVRLALDPSVGFWLFLQRAGEIDSMVSPVLPLMLGGLGYAVWSTWHLHRVALLRNRTTFEDACAPEVAPRDVVRKTVGTALRDDLRRAARTMGRIRERLFQVVPSPWALAILAGFACLGTWLWPQFGQSLESVTLVSAIGNLSSFDWLFRTTVLAMLFAIAWGAFRMLTVWSGLRQVLEAFAAMPIVPAFERLPSRLARLTRLTLPGLATRTSTGMVADLQWLHLQRIYQLRRGQILGALGDDRAALAAEIEQLMQGDAVQHVSLGVSGRRALAERFRSLHAVLRELWRLEPSEADLGALEQALGKEFDKPESSNPAATTLRIRRGFAGPVGLWLRAAEEYAATRMVEYTEWVVRSLRLLAGFLVLSLVLATLLVASYPYHPQSLLRALLLMVLLGAVGSLLLVLVQMNRDEVLSRIARTEPGRLTWDFSFVLHLAAFVAVPLLTLLSSEFPALRGLLFAWVQPVVQMLVRQ